MRCCLSCVLVAKSDRNDWLWSVIVVSMRQYRKGRLINELSWILTRCSMWLSNLLLAALMIQTRQISRFFVSVRVQMNISPANNMSSLMQHIWSNRSSYSPKKTYQRRSMSRSMLVDSASTCKFQFHGNRFQLERQSHQSNSVVVGWKCSTEEHATKVQDPKNRDGTRERWDKRWMKRREMCKN